MFERANPGAIRTVRIAHQRIMAATQQVVRRDQPIQIEPDPKENGAGGKPANFCLATCLESRTPPARPGPVEHSLTHSSAIRRASKPSPANTALKRTGDVYNNCMIVKWLQPAPGEPVLSAQVVTNCRRPCKDLLDDGIGTAAVS